MNTLSQEKLKEIIATGSILEESQNHAVEGIVNSIAELFALLANMSPLVALDTLNKLKIQITEDDLRDQAARIEAHKEKVISRIGDFELEEV